MNLKIKKDVVIVPESIWDLNLGKIEKSSGKKLKTYRKS